MGILSSLLPKRVARSARLIGIMNRLEDRARTMPDMAAELRASHLGQLSPRDQPVRELVEFCFEEPALVAVLVSHNTDRQRLADAFRALEVSGLGQRIKGYYAAAAVLTWPGTLDAILREMQKPDGDRHWPEFSWRLIQACRSM